MSREKPDSSSGGLKIQTLLISALSSVVAATVVPLFWARGTVIATAMMPVVVALASEALRRPVERVSAVAPKVTAVRRSRAQKFEGERVRGRPRARVGAPDHDPHDFHPVADMGAHEPVGVSAEDPFGLREPVRRRPWWKVGLITGVLAFVIAAAVLTASELAIFGGSVSGDRGRTTLFGGSTHHHASSKSNDEPNEQSTPQPGATPTPQATATPTPTATATPTPTATPPPAATPTQAPTTQAEPQATATP